MATSSETTSFVMANASKLASVDYEKMREIARVIYDRPDILADFEQNPELTAKKINGFEVPEGFHIHISDHANTFYPPEEAGVFGDAETESWSRMEVRAGYKTLSLVVCI